MSFINTSNPYMPHPTGTVGSPGVEKSEPVVQAPVVPKFDMSNIEEFLAILQATQLHELFKLHKALGDSVEDLRKVETQKSIATYSPGSALVLGLASIALQAGALAVSVSPSKAYDFGCHPWISEVTGMVAANKPATKELLAEFGKNLAKGITLTSKTVEAFQGFQVQSNERARKECEFNEGTLQRRHSNLEQDAQRARTQMDDMFRLWAECAQRRSEARICMVR